MIKDIIIREGDNNFVIHRHAENPYAGVHGD